MSSSNSESRKRHEAHGERVEVYRDHAGEWRWRSFSANGEELGRSTEGYVHKDYAATRAAAENQGRPLVVLDP